VSTKYWGCDLSLGHGAIVQLKGGKLDNFWFWTEKAGIAKLGKKHGVRMELPKGLDGGTYDVLRLAWIHDFIETRIDAEAPDFIALEAYALGKSFRAHQIGEVGGLARLLFLKKSIPFRLYDPLSVKMFAAHDGTADKTNMRWSVQRRWKCDFDRFNPPKTGKKQTTETSEDLCDAMAIAQLVRLEALLRAGKRALADLKHDKDRRVFLRTTKAEPVNILGRDWIRKPFRIAA
jgi:Holliday junction resolvasome RuvABC endonuclease subunit